MTQQRAIGSGFSARTTATEVLHCVDLSGKTAIVTGAYSGIGIETARALARAGARVIAPARSAEKAKAALAGVEGVAIAAMDLGDLGSVVRFARDVAASFPAVDMLINNAGVMAPPLSRIGNGWESQFAINHLGHFVLARELAPLLRAAEGARVVALSSVAHRRNGILWDDVHFMRTPYDKWAAYAQSKTANALFALELASREAPHGVSAYSVHPGGIMTPLQRHLEKEEMVALGWIDETGELSAIAKTLFKSPEEGGATAVWCAVEPRLSPFSGAYCEDCDIAEPFNPQTPWRGVMAHAVDREAAARLWSLTEAMLA